MRALPVLLVCAFAAASCHPAYVPPPGLTDKKAEKPTAKKTPAKENPPFDPDYKKPPRMNARGAITSISLEAFFPIQQSGNALIVDARPHWLYQVSHIPGAISIPAHGESDPRIKARENDIAATVKAGKPVIVYCTNFLCKDARTLATHISGFGYPVTVFNDGWDGWKDAGLPTE